MPPPATCELLPASHSLDVGYASVTSDAAAYMSLRTLMLGPAAAGYAAGPAGMSTLGARAGGASRARAPPGSGAARLQAGRAGTSAQNLRVSRQSGRASGMRKRSTQDDLRGARRRTASGEGSGRPSIQSESSCFTSMAI